MSNTEHPIKNKELTRRRSLLPLFGGGSMITSIAWKNIWRSRARSAVITGAIAIGMFAGVFTLTFYKGMINERIEAGIETEVSHIQIHNPGFSENFELKYFIPESETLTDQLLKEPFVSGVSSRLVAQGMVASAETGTGVKILGIDPKKEKTATNLYKKLSEGQYMEGVRLNPILIGKKLAEKLKVKLHSKVVVTLQDAQGHLTNEAFRICGIFSVGNGMFEETNAFVLRSDLARVVQMDPKTAHEILVHLKNNDRLDEDTQVLAGKYSTLLVQNWLQLAPELGVLNAYSNGYIYIFIVIILLSLGFGIVNTMLMAVMERVKEIGMLMAIGMNKFRIFRMLMLETILLTLTGGIIGIILGVGVTLITRETGIDLSFYGKALEDMGYSPMVYPVIEIKMIVVVVCLVLATGIIASVYPARKALKYKPAEAIRIDM